MRRLLALALAGLVATGCANTNASGASNDDARETTPATETTTPATLPSETETPPIDTVPADPSYNFAVIGDFGSGTIHQLNVAARMCDWRKDHPFDDVYTVGDNIYPSGKEKFFRPKFFQPYACLFQEGVQWHAALGNHDWVADNGRPELQEPRFGMQGRNYVVRENGVKFVIANSNRLNRTWLRRNTKSEPGDLWTVVIFHHPVYSPGTHGSTPGFENLPDLFSRRGVDLVLNGHDHFYASIKPQQGVRYVVTGGGGAELYPCLPAYFTDICEERYHFLYVEAEVDKLTIRAITAQGRPIDRIEIAAND
jgi:Calcineurin-like phosphoesterase